MSIEAAYFELRKAGATSNGARLNLSITDQVRRDLERSYRAAIGVFSAKPAPRPAEASRRVIAEPKPSDALIETTDPRQNAYHVDACMAWDGFPRSVVTQDGRTVWIGASGKPWRARSRA